MSGTAKHTQHCLSVSCKKKGLKSLLLYIHISVSYFLTPAHTDIIHQPCKCNTVFSCIYITAAISKFYASAYFSDFIFKAIYINRTLDCFRFFSFTSSIMVSACWKSGKNILPFVPSILALRFNSCPIVWTDSAVHPSLYVSLRQL